jgi:hypothetical protein
MSKINTRFPFANPLMPPVIPFTTTTQPVNVGPSQSWLGILVLLLFIAFLSRGGCDVTLEPKPIEPEPVVPVETPGPVGKLIVIIYEATEQAVPVYAHAARFALEELGYRVQIVDQHTKDSTGRIPPDIAPAINTVATTGLPSLVVLDGSTVVKSIRLPSSYDAIIREVTK